MQRHLAYTIYSTIQPKYYYLTFPGMLNICLVSGFHWIALAMWEKDEITSKEGYVDLYIVNVCNSSLHLVANKIPVKYDIFWMP